MNDYDCIVGATPPQHGDRLTLNKHNGNTTNICWEVLSDYGRRKGTNFEKSNETKTQKPHKTMEQHNMNKIPNGTFFFFYYALRIQIALVVRAWRLRFSLSLSLSPLLPICVAFCSCFLFAPYILSLSLQGLCTFSSSLFRSRALVVSCLTLIL